MAILEIGRGMYPVEGLSQAWEKASKGVMLVYSSPPSGSEAKDRFEPVGTAWLITETLAVVPQFSINNFPGPFHCRAFGEADIFFEAEPLLDSSYPEPVSPALLRLRGSLPERALTLADNPPREGDPVFLLHYAQGIPELQFSFGTASFGFEEQFRTESLRYDADTDRGSGGAPIFNDSWELVGMHAGRENAQMPSYNWGVPLLPAMLMNFQETSQWAEIAQYHE